MKRIPSLSLITLLAAGLLCLGASATQAGGHLASEAGADAHDAAHDAHNDASDAWDDAKDGASEAWGKTKDGSAKAWDKTKDGANQAMDKTKDGSAKAWDKTKDGAQQVADKTKDPGGLVEGGLVEALDVDNCRDNEALTCCCYGSPELVFAPVILVVVAARWLGPSLTEPRIRQLRRVAPARQVDVRIDHVHQQAAAAAGAARARGEYSNTHRVRDGI